MEKPTLPRRLARFLLERLLRLYYTARHPQTPRMAALAFFAAVAYALFPLDLIPDLLPLIGIADDATGLLGAAWLLSRYTNDETRAQARARANHLLGIRELP